MKFNFYMLMFALKSMVGKVAILMTKKYMNTHTYIVIYPYKKRSQVAFSRQNLPTNAGDEEI